jgi:hypothetical protein
MKTVAFDISEVEDIYSSSLLSPETLAGNEGDICRIAGAVGSGEFLGGPSK